MSVGSFADKCHTCIGILIDLGLKFWFNLHAFAVYPHISPIMLGFDFFRVLIADVSVSS